VTDAVRLRAVAVTVLTIALTLKLTGAEVGRKPAHRSVFLMVIGLITPSGNLKSGYTLLVASNKS
jgi:hypothetical protein